MVPNIKNIKSRTIEFVKTGLAAALLLGTFGGVIEIATQLPSGAAQAITAATPATGTTLGGTPFVVNGATFGAAPAVTLGGTAATGCKAGAGGTARTKIITCVSAAHAPGKVILHVKSTKAAPRGGTTTKATGWNYTTPAPTITTVVTKAGSTAGKTTVTIKGTNFETPEVAAATQKRVTAVHFGTTAGTTIAVTATTSLTVATPKHAPGKVKVSVTTTSSAGAGEGGGTFTTATTTFTFDPPLPTITTVTKPTGSTAGSAPTTVAISGTNFFTPDTAKSDVVTLKIQTTVIPAATYTVTATKITVKTPKHKPGHVNVSVLAEVTVAGTEYLTGTGTATKATGYEYKAPKPTVTTVTPARGVTTGGTAANKITVTGTNFTTPGGGTLTVSVTFGTTAATTVSVTSSTQLTAVFPPHAAGKFAVVVTTKTTPKTFGGGSNTPVADFTYFVAAPTVTSVSPTSGLTTGTTPVTIDGKHFFTTTTGRAFVKSVKFGTTTATIVSVTSTTVLKVKDPKVASGGVVSVFVTTTGAGSLATAFTYNTPLPTVTRVTPPTGTSTGAQDVTVFGTSFVTGKTAISFGGDPATIVKFFSSTHIEVATPEHAAGKVTVTVVTSPAHGGGKAALPLLTGFTYKVPAPSLTTFKPTTALTSGGTSITITGNHFWTNANSAHVVTKVLFGGTPSSTVSITSTTSLIAEAPAQLTTGKVTVTVVTKGGTKSLPNFEYKYGLPTASSAVPGTGTPSGGTPITLHGTNFIKAKTKVKIGGTTATFVTVTSSTQLTLVTPPHAGTGVVPVVVTTAPTLGGGTGPAATIFKYQEVAPTLATPPVSPTSGPWTGTTVVTISGKHLTRATTVKFGTLKVTTFTSDTATAIVLKTPPRTTTPGKVSVTVNTSHGSVKATTAFRYFAPKATINAVTPATGYVTGGTATVILGKHLSGTTSVKFGSTNVAPTKLIVSTKSIIVESTPPASTPGVVSVTVHTKNGTTVDASPGYTYIYHPPVITTIIPATGTVTGGKQIVVTGKHLDLKTGTPTVKFGTTLAPTVHVTSATKLTVTTPASPGKATGKVTLSVTTTAGTGSKKTGFTYLPPVPTVTLVSPTGGPTTGETLVTIAGANFTGATTVFFGTTQQTQTITVKTTGKKLTVLSPNHVKATVKVTVKTPAGTSTASTTILFTYAPPGPVPTSVTPTFGLITGGTVVTVLGSHFTGVTTVKFGSGFGKTIHVTAGGAKLTVKTPKHTEGLVSVVLSAPTEILGRLTTSFTFKLPAPAVSSISPTDGKTTGGTILTIVGSHLTPSTLTVTFGGTALGTTIEHTSPSEIKVKAPSHAVGTVTVTVKTPGGSDPVAKGYTFITETMTISSVSPDVGPTSGGTPVVITGSHFTTVSSVDFGSTNPATGVNMTSSTTISATTKAHAFGKVTVIIGAKGLPTGFDPTAFTYYTTTQSVTGVSPSFGPTSGGTAVTVMGTGFDRNGGVTSVLFGTTPGTSVALKSTTSLTVTSPPHSSGAVEVTVLTKTNLDGGAKAAAFDYYKVAQKVTSVVPATGSSNGKTNVTINGFTFKANGGVTKVYFGPNLASNLVVISTNSISVTTPAHLGGGAVSVTVITKTTTGGSKATAFFYSSPAPVVAKVSPMTGPTSGGTHVVITGSNFTTVTGVFFGKIAATTVTRVSANEVLAATPAQAALAFAVKVTTATGISTSTVAFTFVAPTTSAITSVTPAIGPDTGQTEVTLRGKKLTSVTQISFGPGIATTLKVVSSTEITAKTPSATIPGSVSVAAFSGTKLLARATGLFTYFKEYQTVTSVTPSTGKMTSKTPVVITGQNFTSGGGVTTVFFGAKKATTVVVESGTQITANAPTASVEGAVTVTVKTAKGTGGAKATAFSYFSPVTITSLTPDTGPLTGGTKVTITGSKFTGVLSVTFGSTAGTNLKVETGGKIIVVTSPKVSATGRVAITVTTPSGTSTKPTGFLFFTPNRTITSLSPNSSSTTGGVVVTITGTYLTGVTTVHFGTALATTVHIISSNEITAKNPAHSSGVVGLTLGVSGTTVARKTDVFTYVPSGAPSSITPVNLTSGNGTVTVAWIVPSNNGSSITGFILTIVITGVKQTPQVVLSVGSPGISGTAGATDTYTIGGVRNGATVKVSVSAINKVGQSGPSATKIVRAGEPALTKKVNAVAADKQATLTWQVPTGNGSAVTSFVITPYLKGIAHLPVTLHASGGALSAKAGATDTYKFKGLTDGDTYYFAVSSGNAIGYGPAGKSGNVSPFSGLWSVSSKGSVANYGSAGYFGSEAGKHLNAPIVAMTATANNKGYYLLASDGGMFTFGNAPFLGSTGKMHLARPIKAMALMPTGKGYWLAEENGKVFAFGKAKKYGTAIKDHPFEITSIASTSNGKGYWLVTVLGRVFHFGDAKGYGTLAKKYFKPPIVGFAPTVSNKGYWMVNEFGQVFRFGPTAKNYGTFKSKHVKASGFVIGMATSIDGNGYWISESNGVLASFGDAEVFKAKHKLTSLAVDVVPMH